MGFTRPILETIGWLVQNYAVLKCMDFRVKLLGHGQMLKISDALITKPNDQLTQNRGTWNLLSRRFKYQYSINVPNPISNLEMLTDRNGYWIMTSPMGQLVLNFRPVAGGFKCNVGSQSFLYAYFWAPRQWKNTWGSKNSKVCYFWTGLMSAPAPAPHPCMECCRTWWWKESHSP